MSRFPGVRSTVPSGFPRVSGDEPLEDLTGEASVMFSPRERG